MIRLRTSSRHPIGLDVGQYGARLLQLSTAEPESSGPRVLAAARVVWPEDVRQKFGDDPGAAPPVEAIAPLLLKMLNRGQFRGRDVSLSIPRGLVRVKNLRLPVMPPEEALAAAELDARMLFGVDEAEANVQVFLAGEVRQGTDQRLEMIAVCVMRAEVDAFVERWHRCGFRPASLDVEPAALYRTMGRFVRRRDDEAEVNVLLEIGQRQSNVLIGRGRQLSFFKSIEIGGQQLTRAVARKLSLDVADAIVLRHRLSATHDPDRVVTREDPVRQAVIDGVRPIVEELGREVSLCLRYFSVNFRGQRPVRVRVVGGESADPTVLRLLGNTLPVPVEAGRPIANADCTAMPAAERSGSSGDWAHAFGLALRFTRGPFADRAGISRAAAAAAAEREAAIAASSASAATSAAAASSGVAGTIGAGAPDVPLVIESLPSREVAVA